MTTPINPVDVETAIRTCSDRIARGVLVCDERYGAFLVADADYDKAFARAYLNFDGPAHRAKYVAVLEAAEAREVRDAADRAYRYADRQAKALEAELRAWQSVNKSVVSMYGAVGSHG